MKRALILAMTLLFAISGIANAAKPIDNLVQVSDQRAGVPFEVMWQAQAKYGYLFVSVTCPSINYDVYRQVRYERWNDLTPDYTVPSATECVAKLWYARYHNQQPAWVVLDTQAFNVAP